VTAAQTAELMAEPVTAAPAWAATAAQTAAQTAEPVTAAQTAE
jgi:hypothetical protein